LARLLETGRVEETIHFAPPADAKLTYALEHAAMQQEMTVRYGAQEVAVVLSFESASKWAKSEQVGMSGNVDVGKGCHLEVLVEKDFACLDGKHMKNEDTFPNPNRGAVC